MKASARPAPSRPLNQTGQPAGEGSPQSSPIDIPKLSKSKACSANPAAQRPADADARKQRTVSCSTVASSSHSQPRSVSSSLSSSLHKTSSHWIKSEPTVNVHTTCGRHTDQFFFTGPSLAELARSVVKKKS